MQRLSKLTFLDKPSSRSALLFLLVILAAVFLLYGVRAEEVLKAVVDPSGPQVGAMRKAFLGYVLYGSSVLAIILFALFSLAGGIRREGVGLSSLPVVLGGTLMIVGVYVDTLVFRDYGIHFYEYDLLGLLTDAATARDVGIRRQDLLLASAAVGIILVMGFVLYAVVGRVARALPSGTGPVTAALLPLVGMVGLGLFGTLQGRIRQDRHDFLSTLPAKGIFLPGSSGRPHLLVEPRLGSPGYPDPRDPATAVPVLRQKKNVFLILADGLRADHVVDSLGLTANLMDFAGRPEVISSRRHFSTGPFTEMGVYGLAYGLNAYTYFSFLEHNIPSFPLEVFRRNGYVVALITGSRILQFPTGQLLDTFDEVITVDEDPAVFEALVGFFQARKEDGRPYFLISFYYAPHWPFDSVEEENRRFRPDMADGGRSPFSSVEDSLFRARVRNSYRNSVIQFDERFAQTFGLVRDEYEAGRTLVGVTSDHGTELWDHGLMGQGRSTFWNEKIMVPFLLGLPGASIPKELKEPEISSHVDLIPTLFQYLQATPGSPSEAYSHGRSLLELPSVPQDEEAFLTGRYFPWADRMNALVTGEGKFWFNVAQGEYPGDLMVIPARAMDLKDQPLPGASLAPPEGSVRSFESEFWRFLKPGG